MNDTITTDPAVSVAETADAEHDAVTAAEQCAARCVRRIQEHPFQGVLCALFAGLLMGACLRR